VGPSRFSSVQQQHLVGVALRALGAPPCCPKSGETLRFVDATTFLYVFQQQNPAICMVQWHAAVETNVLVPMVHKKYVAIFSG
jgi:hypothetical protein